MGLFGIKNKKEKEHKFPYAEKLEEVKQSGEKYNEKDMGSNMRAIFREQSGKEGITKVDVYNELSLKKNFDIETFDKSFDNLKRNGEIYEINGKYKWTK